MSEQPPRTLLQRINAVMKDVSYVQKDKSIDIKDKAGQRVVASYKVVTHDMVTAAVRPALVEHGIYYYPHTLDHQQNGNRTEMFITVRFVNIDDREDFIDVPCLGYGIDQGDKGPGKAMSYAVKYALLKALGLETGEDADNEVTEHKPETKGAPVPKGPKGGKPKPERNEKQIALEWRDNGEARAAVYPFTDWQNIGLFLDDLAVAIQSDPSAWDTNMNDIHRVREKIHDAGHAGLTDKLQDIEIQLEAQFLKAG